MADISSYHEVCAGFESTFHHYIVVRIGCNPETLARDNKIGGSPEPPHYSRGFLFVKPELRSSEYFDIVFEKRFGDEASKILRHRQVQNQCGCALGAPWAETTTLVSKTALIILLAALSAVTFDFLVDRA